MADGPTNPGSIPVGGVYATVEIEVAPDLDAALNRVRDGLEAINAASSRSSAGIGEYAVSTEAGAVALESFAVMEARSASNAEIHAASLRSVATATKDVAQATDRNAASLSRAAGQSRSASYGFFQVAYAIDDIQYGLPALTNNIVGLTTAFGGNSAAVAGTAVGLVTVVALYNNADVIARKLTDALYTGIPITKSAADEMEELGKKTHKSADELERYNELKERQKRSEATSGIKGEEAETQESAVNAALKAAGGGKKVKGQLAEVLLGSNVTQIPEFEEELAKAREDAKKTQEGMAAKTPAEFDAVVAARTKRIREEYAKARNRRANEQAGSIVDEATVDPDHLKALQGYVKQKPGAFSPKLAPGLEKATPENVQKAIREKETKELKQQGREHHDVLEKMFDAEDKANAESFRRQHGVDFVPLVGGLPGTDDKRDIRREISGQNKDAAALKRDAKKVAADFKGPMGPQIQAWTRQGLNPEQIKGFVAAELQRVGVNQELIAEAAHEIVAAGVNRVVAGNARGHLRGQAQGAMRAAGAANMRRRKGESLRQFHRRTASQFTGDEAMEFVPGVGAMMQESREANVAAVPGLGGIVNASKAGGATPPGEDVAALLKEQVRQSQMMNGNLQQLIRGGLDLRTG